MKRLSKKSWALALALAMILSLFTGISAKAETGGLVIAFTDFDETEDGQWYPVKRQDDGEYQSFIDINVNSEEILYLGWSKDNPVTEEQFNEMGLLVYRIEGDQEEQYGGSDIQPYGYPLDIDQNVKQDGFYVVRFEETGQYKITINGNSVIINVNMPEFGIYTDTTYDLEHLAMYDNQVTFQTDKSSTYYLYFNNDK